MVGKKAVFIKKLLYLHWKIRPCTTCLLLQQIYKDVFCKRSLLKLSNKIFEKYLNESSFLVKLQVLKMNSFSRFFQGFYWKLGLSNLFLNFWEDCFRKLKLLFAANRLIYLNISMDISKINGPGPLAHHSFLHRITSGVITSRYLFHEVEKVTSL